MNILSDWVSLQGCDMLACHNYWHWALYHIEQVSKPNLRCVCLHVRVHAYVKLCLCVCVHVGVGVCFLSVYVCLCVLLTKDLFVCFCSQQITAITSSPSSFKKCTSEIIYLLSSSSACSLLSLPPPYFHYLERKPRSHTPPSLLLFLSPAFFTSYSFLHLYIFSVFFY